MENELALKVDNVKKRYRLGVIGGGTLQGDIQSWWARIRGKEDPNTKIGTSIDTKKGTFMALDGISFEVKKGERLGIIGGNGAGKSTTLKILSRVTAPTGGEIYINGRISSMLEVGTGFHPELTGRENIYLNGAILGMNKEEVDRKIEDIIEFSECRQFIDTPVKRYSSGMYVKLAFSVAAHLDSEILIMDEVLAVGDMKFQQKCLQKMQDVAENEGRTILYVSHNMNTIRQLCDRCIVLDKGKVVYDGDVEKSIEVYMDKQGNLEQTFYDLSKKSTKTDICAKILSAELLNKTSAVYDVGERIRVKFKVQAKKSIDQLCLRCELRYADDIPVGTVPELYIGEFRPDEAINYIVDMGTDNLTRGKYKVDLVAFEKDQSGNSIDYDIVLSAFYFELQDDDSIVWNTNTWGHIKFTDVKFEINRDTDCRG